MVQRAGLGRLGHFEAANRRKLIRTITLAEGWMVVTLMLVVHRAAAQ